VRNGEIGAGGACVGQGLLNSHSRRDLFLGLWSVSRISISSEDRRPKLLETGAVGRVQCYKRGHSPLVCTMPSLTLNR
jgi:hypothetical protein